MAEHEHELIGVFRDEQAAREAAEATHAPTGDVRVGEGRDNQAALRAEMREEIDHTVVGAGVGPFTKEMTKGLLWGTALASALGLLLGLPFGFIPFGDSTLATRLVITGGVGAAAGAVLGFVLGGGWGGAADSNKRLAAERGVTVAAPDTPATVKALLEKGPIRVDRVTRDGQPVATVTTEEQAGD